MRWRQPSILIMIIIWIIFVIIAVYFLSTWNIECSKNALCKMKKGIDIFILGSTYAYYDFDFRLISHKKQVCNASYIAQYLDYDYVILKHYYKRIAEGGVVIMTFPDFVFACGDTNARRKHYYEGLSIREITSFDLLYKIKLIIAAAREPFTHAYRKIENKWNGHIATLSEKENHARTRIRDWEQGLGIPSVGNAMITDELKAMIEKNINIAKSIIELCVSSNIKVVGVIPPVSSLIKEYISAECLQTYLFEPISKLKEDTSIPIFNYMSDETLCDIDLYMNSDCLNEKGRMIFMKRILEDLGL